jgi:hypothetical protein
VVLNGIQLDDATITAFCQRHHIKRLACFGSVLRNDFRPESDVDMLVEFEPDAKIGFIRMAEMEHELAEVFGHRVEMYTPSDLSSYFRDEVMEEAQTLNPVESSPEIRKPLQKLRTASQTHRRRFMARPLADREVQTSSGMRSGVGHPS